MIFGKSRSRYDELKRKEEARLKWDSLLQENQGSDVPADDKENHQSKTSMKNSTHEYSTLKSDNVCQYDELERKLNDLTISKKEKSRCDNLDSPSFNTSNGFRADSSENIVSEFQVPLLEQLLDCCGQNEPISMSSLFPTKISLPALKFGEATYSDVYLIDDEATPQALKIIPLAGANQLPLDAALRETRGTFGVGNIKLDPSAQTSSPGADSSFHFPKLYRAAVVNSYDSRLIKLWEDYAKENTSENTDPSKYNVSSQLYLMLFMQFGGTDLEHTPLLTTQKKLRSIWMQVLLALAQAEQQIEFEHRDLHWGNILVESTNQKSISYYLQHSISSPSAASVIEIPTNGVKATIIDFTLSRQSLTKVGKQIVNGSQANGRSHPSNVNFMDLDSDPELFCGQDDDDLQFEVYRWMRDEIHPKNQRERNEISATKHNITKDKSFGWHNFHPKTNCFWILYLLDKLSSTTHFPTKQSFFIENTEKLALLKQGLGPGGKYTSLTNFIYSEFISESGLLFGNTKFCSVKENTTT